MPHVLSAVYRDARHPTPKRAGIGTVPASAAGPNCSRAAGQVLKKKGVFHVPYRGTMIGAALGGGRELARNPLGPGETMDSRLEKKVRYLGRKYLRTRREPRIFPRIFFSRAIPRVASGGVDEDGAAVALCTPQLTRTFFFVLPHWTMGHSNTTTPQHPRHAPPPCPAFADGRGLRRGFVGG